jgi:hypothetical protein
VLAGPVQVPIWPAGPFSHPPAATTAVLRAIRNPRSWTRYNPIAIITVENDEGPVTTARRQAQRRLSEDERGKGAKTDRWSPIAIMAEFLATPTASIVLSLAGLAVLVAIGLYLIGKVRSELTDQTDGANEHLSKFREMHFQGGLSDEEYRTIKAMLAEPLKQELKADAKED